MAANKTEKPTPQRRRKAREKGQVARSRDLASALAWAGVIAVMAWQAPSVVRQWRGLMQSALDLSISQPLTPNGPALFWSGVGILSWTAPVMMAAWVLAVGSSLAQGGFVFAPEALAPKIDRMSPASKLKSMFSLTAVSGLLKSLLPFAVIVWIAVAIMIREWHSFLSASYLGAAAFGSFVLAIIWEMLWKSVLVLVAWSGVDYLLVWRKLEGDLKMTKQEMRQELKDSEGNPAIKGRIRRIQRQMRRKQMLHDTEKASVVITNPTHFAVALRYDVEMEAPIVVAKGRDLLAQQIKEVARWHGIAIMENPPLAQALYRTVELGQPIPAKLYTAVAEILAFVFRAQAQAQQARGTAR
jgi:flagellar biosynthesis protein FlhB